MTDDYFCTEAILFSHRPFIKGQWWRDVDGRLWRHWRGSECRFRRGVNGWNRSRAMIIIGEIWGSCRWSPGNPIFGREALPLGHNRFRRRRGWKSAHRFVDTHLRIRSKRIHWLLGWSDRVGNVLVDRRRTPEKCQKKKRKLKLHWLAGQEAKKNSYTVTQRVYFRPSDRPTPPGSTRTTCTLTDFGSLWEMDVWIRLRAADGLSR